MILDNFLSNSKNCNFLDLFSYLFIVTKNKLDTENIFSKDSPLFPLFTLSNKLREKYYSKKIFLRALIEFTSYCKNSCLYCGISSLNKNAKRYRLSEAEIFSCAKNAYEMGFRTLVLQGGEDPYFTDEILCRIIKHLRENFPDVAITLSIGERTKESYKALYKAGANRYLLRHETACALHYQKLHGASMSFENRRECLYNLKEIGYQTGAGFMIGSPFQTKETLTKDFLFLQDLKPQMVGIGPFIKHKETSFSDFSEDMTTEHKLLFTISVLAATRVLLPSVLLPATTALSSLHKKGRILGLSASCNVLMINVTPLSNRSKYLLYDGKDTSIETIQFLENIKTEIESEFLNKFSLSFEKGDFVDR